MVSRIFTVLAIFLAFEIIKGAFLKRKKKTTIAEQLIIRHPKIKKIFRVVTVVILSKSDGF